MFVQQILMLRDIAVIEIGDSCIQQDVEKKCEIEDGEIESIALSPDNILHCPVNPENPEGFDQ
jgi:hypothetical protein